MNGCDSSANANGHHWVCRLGRISYDRALELQRRLAQLRFEGRIDDILLELQHPPTVTLGRFGKKENLLISEDEMRRRGIAFCRSDRGGDATLHCPGQLVIYPITDLRTRKGRLRDFLSQLEEVVILTLKSFGVSAERWPEHPGIWVEGRQIGAVGLRISRGISMHGLSLNVDPDPELFRAINICGLPGLEATSIHRELGEPVEMRVVVKNLERIFEGVFQTRLETISFLQVKEDSLAGAIVN
jgi:lipoate-protein ligase B